MRGREILANFTRVTSVAPQSCAAAVAGDYISLKNINRCVVEISLGAINTSVTVQLRQATAVAGTGAKALNFTHVWRRGGKIGITGTSGTFSVGETVTGGTSSATGVIYSLTSSEMVLYTISGTFQSGETLTGGTSSATATSTSAITEDGSKMKVALTAANTVALTLGSQTYEIEVDPASLDVANGFDCIMADVSAVAGGAGICGISYLIQPKYTQDPQLSHIYD